MELALYDTATSEDINIAEAMVREGMAEFTPGYAPFRSSSFNTSLPALQLAETEPVAQPAETEPVAQPANIEVGTVINSGKNETTILAESANIKTKLVSEVANLETDTAVQTFVNIDKFAFADAAAGTRHVVDCFTPDVQTGHQDRRKQDFTYLDYTDTPSTTVTTEDDSFNWKQSLLTRNIEPLQSTPIRVRNISRKPDVDASEAELQSSYVYDSFSNPSALDTATIEQDAITQALLAMTTMSVSGEASNATFAPNPEIADSGSPWHKKSAVNKMLDVSIGCGEDVYCQGSTVIYVSDEE